MINRAALSSTLRDAASEFMRIANDYDEQGFGGIADGCRVRALTLAAWSREIDVELTEDHPRWGRSRRRAR